MTEDPCTRWHLLIQADHDGELGVAEAAALAGHLAGCAACRALRDDLSGLTRALRAEGPRYAAPASLRAALQRHAATPAPRPPRRILLWAAPLALAASLAALAVVWPGGTPPDDMVASHIRALQPGHLTDVLSTDQHTVKPWFNGRLDYSPPVRDFAASGFPLLGGRLDYLAHRPVAALVYGRDRHVIDLYVWPDTSPASGARAADGYNVLAWGGGGLQFAAVSDLNMPELRQFAALWRDSPP